MSQSQRKRKTQPSQSRKTEDVEDMQKLSIEELSKKCVRFFLTKMNSNSGIKRADIVQHVFQERPGKSFEVVLSNAVKTLKQVYGLNVEVIDSDLSTKKYIVTNILPYAHLISRDNESDMKSTITFLVLSHIFMSQNNSTDTQLWQFLKEFNITSETDLEDVGNVNQFITQNLVKQHLVQIEDRGGEHENEEPRKCYKWGSRADETVSKMELLKFVSDIYGTEDVKFWTEQYKEATQQFAGATVEE